ncbi:MAG: D-glycero-alpha-D-manno-heptose-1,7-bisphosphate 7-phosphatase [Myxococcota bacterium]
MSAAEDGRTDPARAVFVDRDGVINDVVLREGRPHPPASLEGLHILPGVRESLRALRRAGLRVIVVTNQPDVAKGVQTVGGVEAIHAELRRQLAIDDIETCFHADEDGCECRKPKAGMLRHAAARWRIDLHSSFLVGDRWRDIAAGAAAGCQTFWIDRGYREPRAEAPTAVVTSLAEATERILAVLGLDSERGEEEA